MSGEPVELPPVTPAHYRVLCGVALGAIFLVLFHDGLMLAGLIAMVLGFPALFLRVRVSPLLVLLPVVGGFLVREWQDFRAFGPGWRPHAFLQVPDVLLAIAVLGYLAGHYRLIGLEGNILPMDPRRRAAKVVVPQRRSGGLLSPGEIAWFVLQLPFFALFGQVAWYGLSLPWSLAGFEGPWRQFVPLAWLLLVGLFVAGQLFRYWRRRGMDVMTAQVMLQDELWNETRGEQRRMGRWLAWWKMRR